MLLAVLSVLVFWDQVLVVPSRVSDLVVPSRVPEAEQAWRSFAVIGHFFSDQRHHVFSCFATWWFWSCGLSTFDLRSPTNRNICAAPSPTEQNKLKFARSLCQAPRSRIQEVLKLKLWLHIKLSSCRFLQGKGIVGIFDWDLELAPLTQSKSRPQAEETASGDRAALPTC